MSPLGDESILLIEVPQSEPLVRAYREAHDPVAKLGIPAHITPLNSLILRALARILAGSGILLVQHQYERGDYVQSETVYRIGTC